MDTPTRRQATYADILALPEGINGEIIAGELHTQPRPAGPHGIVATGLGAELRTAFGKVGSGFGGWVIIFEPELHIGGDILVPDIAGWRAERLPAAERRRAFFTTAPDWVCEVLSGRGSIRDREVKLPWYADHGIQHSWLVEPIEGFVEAYARRERLGSWSDAGARIPPFEALALDLANLWESMG